MKPAPPATKYLLNGTSGVTVQLARLTRTSYSAGHKPKGGDDGVDLPSSVRASFNCIPNEFRQRGSQTKSSEAGSWMPFSMILARASVGFQLNRSRALEQS